MIINEAMRKVILNIIKTKVPRDYVSPNFVADVAARSEVVLTSKQVAYISNSF